MPGCVLEMTLKSSCSQSACPRRSLSVATVRSGIAVAQLRLVCSKQMRRREGGETGGRAGREGGAGFVVSTFQSLLLPKNSLSYPSHFLFCQLLRRRVSPAVAPSAGLATIGSLSAPIGQHLGNTSATSQIHCLPGLSLIQHLVIDKALVYLRGWNKLKHSSRRFVRAKALCHGPDRHRSQQDGQTCRW